MFSDRSGFDSGFRAWTMHCMAGAESGALVCRVADRAWTIAVPVSDGLTGAWALSLFHWLPERDPDGGNLPTAFCHRILDGSHVAVLAYFLRAQLRSCPVAGRRSRSGGVRQGRLGAFARSGGIRRRTENAATRSRRLYAH